MWNDEGRKPDAGFGYVRWKSSSVLDGCPLQLQFQDQLLYPILRSLKQTTNLTLGYIVQEKRNDQEFIYLCI